MKKKKEIGLIFDAILKVYIHTHALQVAGESLTEEMNLRLLLTCATLRSLLNLINYEYLFIHLFCFI